MKCELSTNITAKSVRLREREGKGEGKRDGERKRERGERENGKGERAERETLRDKPRETEGKKWKEAEKYNMRGHQPLPDLKEKDTEHCRFQYCSKGRGHHAHNLYESAILAIKRL